jgi:hypothetical protein
MDTAGTVLATITGFRSITAMDATGGFLWVADNGLEQVGRFSAELRGNRDINAAAPLVGGFINPRDLVIDRHTMNCWIVEELGRLVLLSPTGERLRESGGLSQPRKIRILQQVL